MEKYLTPVEVSDTWHIPTETLRYWRAKGEGPPFVRLGRHIRYPQLGAEKWAAQQAVST